MPVAPVRRCRFCGCTPEFPCKVFGGDECAFVNAKADRCSAPGCVLAWEAENERACRQESSRLRALAQMRRKGSRTKNRSTRRAA